MTTSPSSLETALAKVPADFRKRIVDRYGKLKEAYADRQYDACGVRAGRLCEIVLRYLQNELTGSFTPFGTQIKNFADECMKLGKTATTAGPESYRLLIPRALNFAYTLRNKRDFGHEGNELDANEIDAATVSRLMDWCISEIIGVTMAIPMEDAQALLDAIAERQIPLVWAAPGGKKRVLDPLLKQSEQALVLLYNDVETAVPIEDLASWVGAKRVDLFRVRVVVPLHDRRLVEWDQESRTVILSPSGVEAAEAVIRRVKGLP
jgi:hypothetical protein